MAVRRSHNRQIHAAASLKQIINKCSTFCKRECLPEDVPKGHFAVCVGENRSRHIVPISWLAHPEFKDLLRRAEEEYGFKHDRGITIPCEERLFKTVTDMIR